MSGQCECPGLPLSQLQLIDKYNVPQERTGGVTVIELFFDGNDEFRIFENGCQVWHSSDYEVDITDKKWKELTGKMSKVKDWHESNTR